MPNQSKPQSPLFTVLAWCMAGLSVLTFLVYLSRGAFSGVYIGSSGIKLREGLGDFPLPTASCACCEAWLPLWFIGACCAILACVLQWGSRRPVLYKPRGIWPQVAVCLTAAFASFLAVYVDVMWILPTDAQAGIALLIFSPVCAMPAAACVALFRPWRTPMPFGASAAGIGTTGALLTMATPSPAAYTFFLLVFVYIMVGAFVAGGIGAGLRLMVVGDQRPEGENACPLCGYNLTGNVSGRCPECGAVFEKADPPK